MGILGDNPFLALGNPGTVYQIQQSLRFDGSSYIQYPDASFGNETGTYSFWVKRSELGAENTILWNTRVGGHWGFRFDGANTFTLFKTASGIDSSTTTTAVFRDPSAWYHILVTTTSSANEVFVNGTSVATGSYEWAWIDANPRIGYRSSTDSFQGYLAEWHYISGSVKSVSDFTETDDNGVLRPIEYTGTYGTNGYYLKFDPSLTNGILHDSSGQGNDFGSSTGFTTSGTGTDVMSDTPTTNWATLNPLSPSQSEAALSNGNIDCTWSGVSGHSRRANFAMGSGKWYAEVTRGTSTLSVGLVDVDVKLLSWPGNSTYGSTGSYAYRTDNGNKYNNGSGSSYGNTIATGDVIGIAYDGDNGALYFSKNGTWQNSGDPTSGASATGAAFTGLGNQTWTIACGNAGGSTGGTATNFNFGQRAFAYTPPTGFKALNTSNLPAPTIKDGSKYFKTVLYTGTVTDTSTQSVTGVGFKSDWTWIKRRDSGNSHQLVDAVRGAGSWLETNSNNLENSTNTNGVLTSFDADGFTLTGGSTNANLCCENGFTYAAWNWLAGNSTSSNTDGTISSTVSVNRKAGLSIVTYTGTGVNATVGHGLGVQPSFYVVKPRSESNNWPCWHKDLTSDSYYIHLNFALKQDLAATVWNGTGPSSTVFNIGTNTNVNQDTATFVAYVFAEVPGYSRISFYPGNGSISGPFIWTGFRPSYLLIKNYRGGSETNWLIRDSARAPFNQIQPFLYANTDVAEGNNFPIDFLSNGFKIRDDNAILNESGSDFLFLAFAEYPFGGFRTTPVTAR